MKAILVPIVAQAGLLGAVAALAPAVMPEPVEAQSVRACYTVDYAHRDGVGIWYSNLPNEVGEVLMRRNSDRPHSEPRKIAREAGLCADYPSA